MKALVMSSVPATAPLARIGTNGFPFGMRCSSQMMWNVVDMQLN
jgi:hypothetical protein